MTDRQAVSMLSRWLPATSEKSRWTIQHPRWSGPGCSSKSVAMTGAECLLGFSCLHLNPQVSRHNLPPRHQVTRFHLNLPELVADALRFSCRRFGREAFFIRKGGALDLDWSTSGEDATGRRDFGRDGLGFGGSAGFFFASVALALPLTLSANCTLVASGTQKTGAR